MLASLMSGFLSVQHLNTLVAMWGKTGKTLIAGSLTLALAALMVPFGSVAYAQDNVVVSGSIPVEQCPVGYQYSTGIIVNASTGEVFTQCNSPLNAQDLLLQQQDADFQAAISAAQAAAEAESIAWNQAHPGEQKCVQWGPIVHANGVSTSSGGVCANPVPGPALPTAVVRASDVMPTDVPTSDTRITDPIPSNPAPSEVATNSPPAVSSAPSPVIDAIGGWAIVDEFGNNLGTTVCAASVCGDSNSDFSKAYLRDHPGIRFILFAPAQQGGNVAGWNGGTYDAASGLFWLNGCSHPAGTDVSNVNCPVAASPSVGSVAQGLPTIAVREPHASSTSASISSQPIQSPSPSVVDPVTPPVDNSSQTATPNPVSSDFVAADPPTTMADVSTPTRIDPAPTTVSVANLVGVAQTVPKATSSKTITLGIVPVSVKVKSLTASVCGVLKGSVIQKSVGKCRIEFSVLLPDKTKVSTIRVITFRRRA